MWLIERGTDGRRGARIALPEPLLAALIRWYIGGGTAGDEAAGITLVQQARIGARWLACGCLGGDEAPPILTPAYLSDAETYYLRRLTSANRPAHRLDCPFFRDQATARLHDSDDGRPPSPPPHGFFEALRPAPEKLAQRPGSEAVDDRTRHASLPRLARLLRRLLLLSGRTRLSSHDGERTISSEFEAVRAATMRIDVAPGIELGRVLWTHVDAFHSGRATQTLHRMAARWPRGHAVQGFLLLYAREFHGEVVVPADGPPLRIANRVQSPSSREHEVVGPWLVLIVIGQYPEANDLVPLRAFAQPVVSGRCFLPIDENAERPILQHFLQGGLRLPGQAELIIEKPVFDILTAGGECRPDLLIQSRNPQGEVRRAVLQSVSAARFDRSSLARMRSIGPVLEYDPSLPATAAVDRVMSAFSSY